MFAADQSAMFTADTTENELNAFALLEFGTAQLGELSPDVPGPVWFRFA
jgi:hypothetical protein